MPTNIASKKHALPKTKTGIDGLDEITEGGLPKGRPTLICGSAGCGKSLFGIQFLVKGAMVYNEPGVMMSFEETSDDLVQNVSSMGFDLPKLIADKKLWIDHVRIERSEIEETGEYDLEGIFVRLNYAIDAIGAKRVVLDTIETLFGGMQNQSILRSEIRRLFQWLKQKGVTAVITGERGENSLTRQGLEEYVSDCVILLDFRVTDQIATRRLRIVKYRGSTHGTNEYPFLIEEDGISVLPITSLKLDHKASKEIISSGHAGLDGLFGLNGTFRGNSTLVTGTAGTAKTIIASYFALSSCKRNERVLYFSFEESPDQLIRNM
ncbi:MAG: circadian clock protein KaiC, partial [Saprospiraceae bacterium]